MQAIQAGTGQRARDAVLALGAALRLRPALRGVSRSFSCLCVQMTAWRHFHSLLGALAERSNNANGGDPVTRDFSAASSPCDSRCSRRMSGKQTGSTGCFIDPVVAPRLIAARKSRSRQCHANGFTIDAADRLPRTQALFARSANIAMRCMSLQRNRLT